MMREGERRSRALPPLRLQVRRLLPCRVRGEERCRSGQSDVRCSAVLAQAPVSTAELQSLYSKITLHLFNYSDCLAKLHDFAVKRGNARLVDDAREIGCLRLSSASVRPRGEKETHGFERDDRVMPDVGVVGDSLRAGGDKRSEGSEVGLSVCDQREDQQPVCSTERKDAPAPGAATSTRYFPPPPPRGTNA